MTWNLQIMGDMLLDKQVHMRADIHTHTRTAEATNKKAPLLNGHFNTMKIEIKFLQFPFSLKLEWNRTKQLISKYTYGMEVQWVHRIYISVFPVAFECEVLALLRIIEMVYANPSLYWSHLVKRTESKFSNICKKRGRQFIRKAAGFIWRKEVGSIEVKIANKSIGKKRSQRILR